MLGTLLSGATFGFLTSIFKGIMGFFENRSKRNHELLLIEKQKELIIAEAQANVTITKAQVEGAIELSDAEAFKIGQLSEQTDLMKESWINRLFELKDWTRIFAVPVGTLLVFCMGIVDIIRRLMRPALTIYVMVGSSWVTVMAWETLNTYATETGQAIMSPVQAYTIFLQVIDFVFFMAASGFSFWFSDRALMKGLMNKYGSNNTIN